MSKIRQVGLTEGPILKALIALALPIMATSFLNTFYSITDMARIGKLGSRAEAGVGVGGMYVWLSQGLSALAKMGGQVNVAQALGRGRRDEAGQYACSAVQLTVIFAVLFAAGCTLFTDDLYFVLGRHAIDMAEHLKKGLLEKGISFYLESPTNQQFLLLTDEQIERLKHEVSFSFWEKPDEDHTVIRLATSWATTKDQVDELIAVISNLL